MHTLPDEFYSLGSNSGGHLSDMWVVVPSNRPATIPEFISRWSVEDLPGPNFLILYDTDDEVGSHGQRFRNVTEVSLQSMDLGESSWIIPRRTDCIRSFGFLLAARYGAKYILSLDDDCFSSAGRPCDFFVDHMRILESGIVPIFSTTGHRGYEMRPRGLPRDCSNIVPKRVLINHGLWDGSLDLAADDETRVVESLIRRDAPMTWLPKRFHVVPQGFLYPMCGMNISFSVDILPAMYFTLQGRMLVDGMDHKLPYDRWGDVWCGLFSKVVADEIGGCVTSGVPSVFHSRVSLTSRNVEKEAAGHSLHRKLVDHILYGGIIHPRGPICMENTAGMYEDIANSLKKVPDTTPDERAYLRLLSEAMKQWTELCLTFAQGS